MSTGDTTPPDVTSAWANARLWDAEYSELRAIPSSHRTQPSRAFVTLMRNIVLPSDAKILDAGAGTGRHSLYLAAQGYTVHAVDASEVACDTIRERLSKQPDIAGTLSIEKGMLDTLAVSDGAYDLIIDSYVSCHLLTENGRRQYLESLIRRLKPGGFLYTSCIGSDDGCCRNHLTDESPNVAVDPLNQVTKLPKTQQTFVGELSALAKVINATTETFVDTVAGVPYQRQVLAAMLQRPTRDESR